MKSLACWVAQALFCRIKQQSSSVFLGNQGYACRTFTDSGRNTKLSMKRTDLIRKLLKGIETGDPEAAAVVSEDQYIQHNPQTREGGPGLAALFAKISKTNPRVNIVRAFEDGHFVFGHTEYDFATRRIGFEVFRFEGNLAVEHWDNIQPRMGPNESGRSMVDGPTEATDLDLTETNREFVRSFTNIVMITRADFETKLGDFVVESLIQHDPRLTDGRAALEAALKTESMKYEKLHRVLAEGSFVLAVCEGFMDGVHTAFYDLYRIDSGKIVEHWNTIEAVPPKDQWQNNNGKF